MSGKSKGSVPSYKKQKEPEVLTPEQAFHRYFDMPKFTTDSKGNTKKNYKNGGIVNFKGTF